MNNQESKEFSNAIFDRIIQSKSILEIERIADIMNIPTGERMSTDSYPKIEFSINQNEIKSLKDKKIIDANLNFTKDVSSKLTDPLSKLLYSISWKNGDLKKIKHIIKGIEDGEDDSIQKDDALVFYQFGKYLTKKSGQPIIDQHVIRSYAIYCSENLEEIGRLRKLKTLNKSHKILINQYKLWLSSNQLNQELKNEADYTYYIDKLLFATGKTIRFKKPRKKKITVSAD